MSVFISSKPVERRLHYVIADTPEELSEAASSIGLVPDKCIKQGNVLFFKTTASRYEAEAPRLGWIAVEDASILEAVGTETDRSDQTPTSTPGVGADEDDGTAGIYRPAATGSTPGTTPPAAVPPPPPLRVSERASERPSVADDSKRFTRTPGRGAFESSAQSTQSGQEANTLRNRIAQLEHQLLSEQASRDDRIAGLEAELNRSQGQVAQISTGLDAELEASRTRSAELQAELSRTQNRIVELDEERESISRDRAELDKAQIELATEAARRNDRSAKRLDRIVLGGTAVVLAAVAVLTYVGGVVSATRYAHWPLGLALLVPLCIEAGAAVELASLTRNKRRGIVSHWSAKMLAAGLLGASITAMVLHATNAPAGAHRWWAYTIAVGLPLELAALVRASLASDPAKMD